MKSWEEGVLDLQTEELCRVRNGRDFRMVGGGSLGEGRLLAGWAGQGGKCELPIS